MLAPIAAFLFIRFATQIEDGIRAYISKYGLSSFLNRSLPLLNERLQTIPIDNTFSIGAFTFTNISIAATPIKSIDIDMSNDGSAFLVSTYNVTHFLNATAKAIYGFFVLKRTLSVTFVVSVAESKVDFGEKLTVNGLPPIQVNITRYKVDPLSVRITVNGGSPVGLEAGSLANFIANTTESVVKQSSTLLTAELRSKLAEYYVARHTTNRNGVYFSTKLTKTPRVVAEQIQLSFDGVFVVEGGDLPVIVTGVFDTVKGNDRMFRVVISDESLISAILAFGPYNWSAEYGGVPLKLTFKGDRVSLFGEGATIKAKQIEFEIEAAVLGSKLIANGALSIVVEAILSDFGEIDVVMKSLVIESLTLNSEIPYIGLFAPLLDAITEFVIARVLPKSFKTNLPIPSNLFISAGFAMEGSQLVIFANV